MSVIDDVPPEQTEPFRWNTLMATHLGGGVDLVERNKRKKQEGQEQDVKQQQTVVINAQEEGSIRRVCIWW